MTPSAAFAWTFTTSPAKAEWQGSPKRRRRTKKNSRTKARRSMNLQPLRLAAIVLLMATNAALAAKPHYEITGRLLRSPMATTLTVLDESRRSTDSTRRDRRAREGTGFRDKGPRESRRKGVPADGPHRSDRCRSLPREVGRIFLVDRFVNMEMVRDGFAWRLRAIRTSRGNSPLRRSTPASTGEDCGLIPTQCRRGSGGKPSAPNHVDFAKSPTQ